jgi:nitroreductase
VYTPAEGRAGTPDVRAVEAIAGRRSVRRFKDTPVPDDTIRRILQLGSRAATGVNAQPWKVYVATGVARDRISRAVLAAADRGEFADEYPYAPKWFEPYLSRRRKVGYDLYNALGVARDDAAGRKAAALRNFEFFGAPVGLFFTMDRRMQYGQWLDCGMFIANVMIAARAYGLDTCPQQAWCEVSKATRAAVAIPDDEILVTGMSMGLADLDAPENRFQVDREPVETFTTFLSS